MFDRRLRNLFFDAIARIEVSLRAAIAHQWAKVTQCTHPHSRKNFCGLARAYSSKTSKRGQKSQSSYHYMMDKADETFAHAKKQGSIAGRYAAYADASAMPVWEFIDFCTFGPLSTLLAQGLIQAVKLPVAHTFGFSDVQEFVSVISLLHLVRNECAHQGRIWNRIWQTSNGNPRVPKTQRSEWQLAWNGAQHAWIANEGERLVSDNRKTALALTYCSLILQTIAPSSHWKERVKELLGEPRNQAYLDEIGFHAEWESHPLWV